MSDGRVLVTGGFPAMLETWMFDPASSAVGPGPRLMEGRQSHLAVTLADGSVLIAGGVGLGDAQGPLATAELLDPVAGTVRSAGMLQVPRLAAEAVRLDDGRVLIAGGAGAGDGGPVTKLEVFDPALSTFSLVQTEDSVAGALVKLDDGRVVVAGESSAWIFDPENDSVSGIPVSGEYWSGSPVLLTSGEVLMTGGCCAPGGDALHRAGVLDVATGGFTAVDDLNHGRVNHTATRLADGRVLIVGGIGSQDGPREVPTQTAEVYDPETRSFIQASQPVAVRSAHQANLLADGRVLITGGWRSGTPSAEVFTP
ncbi:MAG: kelch repeat-containing protein [Dehalococcoidia bacterium]